MPFYNLAHFSYKSLVVPFLQVLFDAFSYTLNAPRYILDFAFAISFTQMLPKPSWWRLSFQIQEIFFYFCCASPEDAYSSGHLVLSHFGACKCSYVETNLSWTCLVSGLLSFELLFLLPMDSGRLKAGNFLWTCQWEWIWFNNRKQSDGDVASVNHCDERFSSLLAPLMALSTVL